MLFQMAGKNGIYISADGYLLVGNDIHDTEIWLCDFPADIDALACFVSLRLRNVVVIPRF